MHQTTQCNHRVSDKLKSCNRLKRLAASLRCSSDIWRGGDIFIQFRGILAHMLPSLFSVKYTKSFRFFSYNFFNLLIYLRLVTDTVAVFSPVINSIAFSLFTSILIPPHLFFINHPATPSNIHQYILSSDRRSENATNP